MSRYKPVNAKTVASLRAERDQLVAAMTSEDPPPSLQAQLVFFRKGLGPAAAVAAFLYGDPEEVAKTANQIGDQIDEFEKTVENYSERCGANKVMAIALQAASMAVACTTQEMDEDGVAKMAATLDFDPKQLAIALQSAGVKIAGGESGQY